MAKKNKKIFKINQEIKKYFDDDPFDIGIKRVKSETISELFHALGIPAFEHNKKSLLKDIRMLWSSGDYYFRQNVLDFFKADGVIYTSDKETTKDLQKEEKIFSIIEQMDITKEEVISLQSSFINIRTKKITEEKILSRLKHIRFNAKKAKLEIQLDGFFDIDDSLEFNASFKFEIYDESFHKIITINTKQYEYEYLQDNKIDEIVNQIEKDKIFKTKQKQEKINSFLKNLKTPHKYLTEDEIISSIKKFPPKSSISFIPLKLEILQEILKKRLSIIDAVFLEKELKIKVEDKISLPFSLKKQTYILEFHIELKIILEAIWNSKELELNKYLVEAKQEVENHFKVQLSELVDSLSKYASLLYLSDEELYARAYQYLLPLLSKDLQISSKIKRKTLRIFIYNIQEQLIKKQRQALLAQTIRDFKNLYPLAREMKRRLTLHIGATNSGKTYEAMQKLQNADTGYYLAPLRLLALEGYESIKTNSIETSLITGEEQLLNEDATHISSTIEMLNFDVDVDVCVIDEVQMIGDRDRGWAWVNAIIGAPAKEVIMTGSSNSKEAIIALAEYLGEKLEIIEFDRKNPLILLENATPIEEVEEATAIIAFSRKDVLKLKQKFSKFFSVSVVYGNLSPEVRKEEARRFREKETQILIATDAIAMGMNLPIKTILFAKDEKFDGVNIRKLSIMEIAQISGRAGRFGLREEGFVGALDTKILKTIKNNFYKSAKNIDIPFSVMANLGHIKLLGKILEDDSINEILKFFVKNIEFKGPFQAQNLDDMLKASSIVDRFDLDLTTKYSLVCAPLTLKSPYILASYENYISSLEKKQIVKYRAPLLENNFAQTTDDLLKAEDMVKEISLYLWLSYRFEEYFLDTKRAKEYRIILNKYIESSLQRSYFIQKCHICSTGLPVNSKYNICQSCFKKSYKRKTYKKKR